MKNRNDLQNVDLSYLYIKIAQLIKTKNKKEQSIIPRAAAAYRNSGKSVP